MMYGNCLTFAIYDFFKHGGELVISFPKCQRVPHFAVQRDGKVYDLEIVTMILKEFWYWGDSRISNAESLNHFQCKRFGIAKRRITNRVISCAG